MGYHMAVSPLFPFLFGGAFIEASLIYAAAFIVPFLFGRAFIEALISTPLLAIWL